MYLIGIIAFEIAFLSVGRMQYFGLPRGNISSIIHWIIRLFLWLITTLVVATAIRIFKFIVFIPLWAWSVLISLSFIYILYKFKTSNEVNDKIIIKKENDSNIIEEVAVTNGKEIRRE